MNSCSAPQSTAHFFALAAGIYESLSGQSHAAQKQRLISLKRIKRETFTEEEAVIITG